MNGLALQQRPMARTLNKSLISLNIMLVDNNESNGNNSDNQTYNENLSPMGYAICACFLIVIMVFGIFNNLLVIRVILLTKKLWTPINVILLNLSISDFIISMFGTPFSIAAAILGGWPFGEGICQLYGFMMTLAGMTAIGTLVAVAGYRCFIISRALQSNITMSNAVFTIFMIWLYALCLALPPLFGWNRYIIEVPGISCSVDWQTSYNIHSGSYIIYIFTLGYFKPIAVLCLSYGRIAWIIKCHKKPDGTSVVSKAERRVTLMAVVMVIATIIAWTPYAIVSLLVYAGHEKSIPPTWMAIPAIFAKSSTAYNPIVYFYFNTQIRSALLDQLRQICCCCFKTRQKSEEISLDTRGGVTIANTQYTNNFNVNDDEKSKKDAITAL